MCKYCMFIQLFAASNQIQNQKKKNKQKKNTQEIQRETEERETKYEYNIIIKIVEMCCV